MIEINDPIPLDEAIQKIDTKTPLGSALNSEDWQSMPLAIKERAQFSSRVVSLRVLQLIQDKLQSSISLQREKVANGTALVDRSSFIGDVRELVLAQGLSPNAPGIQNLASRERLGLIFDTQTQMAENFARWKMDQDPAILDEYPAQRLIRYEMRKEPRDWRARWVQAGNAVGWKGALRSEMVALKNSPIWRKISYFGTPWPPYDFNSGMGLEDLDRDEAESLGLIGPDDTLEPEEMDFNNELQASVDDLSPDLQGKLKKVFGDQISIEDGKAKFKSGNPSPIKPPATRPKQSVETVSKPSFDDAQIKNISKHMGNFLKEGSLQTGFKKYIQSLKVDKPRSQKSIIKNISSAFNNDQKAAIREGVQEILDILPPALAEKYSKVKFLKNKKRDRSRGSYENRKDSEIPTIRMSIAYETLKHFKATVKHEFMHHLHMKGPDEYKILIEKHYQERTKNFPTRPTSFNQIKQDDFIKGYEGSVNYYAGTKYGFEDGPGSGMEIPTVYVQNQEFLNEQDVLKGLLLDDRETLEKVMSLFYYGRNFNE